MVMRGSRGLDVPRDMMMLGASPFFLGGGVQWKVGSATMLVTYFLIDLGSLHSRARRDGVWLHTRLKRLSGKS